jgi:hypothetical protein
MGEDSVRRLSLARWVFWVSVAPVAFFLGWVYTVWFVALCSLYANWGTDFAAWRADSNKKLYARLDTLEDKLDEILDALP